MWCVPFPQKTPDDDPHRRPHQDAHDRPEPAESAARLAIDGEIEELDWLYRQALDAMESVESNLGQLAEAETSPVIEAATAHTADAGDANVSAPVDAISPPEQIGTDTVDERAFGDDAGMTEPVPVSSEALGHGRGEHFDDEPPAPRPPVTPAQVVEAALFVGGAALTTKKLCTLLRGEFDANFIDTVTGELNARYAREDRPYEIRFGEGGYRMVLRTEFDRLRYRVYGLGPKEVRLSQDALEVLALVAYRQPLAPEDIEQLGKRGAGAVLRQLLRRELIALERDAGNPRQVRYRTTPRFLELFGLADLDELPQAEELSFK